MAPHVEDKHFFSRGADSLVIDLSMHTKNREKLLASVVAAGCDGDAMMFQGGTEMNVYNADTVWDFRQESNFQYLFGVKEPGCLGVIVLNPSTSILFIPRLPKEYAQWMGPIKPRQWFKDTYLVDEVFYVDEMESVLSRQFNIQKLLWYDFTNTDSGISLPRPQFEGVDTFKFVDGPMMAHALNELRLIKSADEVRILQYTNDVSCRAHINTMLEIASQRVGNVMGMEHFAETNFRYQSGLGGCARVGYHCIACSGIRNAILHYGHAAENNNGEVDPNGLRLLDMGSEYHCYTADVTVTIPTSGKFNVEQRIVYEAVWKAVLAVENAIRPGVDYRDMHRLSQRVILEELLKSTSLFTCSTIEPLIESNIGSYFYPHGVGHSLGLDVHDVSGILPGYSKDRSDLSIKGLRLCRPLVEGMVITVEPGVYFIDYLLEDLKADSVRGQLINWTEVERFKLVGGVRIEDNVVITRNGCRVLTDVPRTVEEIEGVMNGSITWNVGSQYRDYRNC